MTHPILSRIPILNKFVDERFLEHRRRSSSRGRHHRGSFSPSCIFEYRFFHDHFWSWEMGAIVAVTIVVLKMMLFAWYRMND